MRICFRHVVVSCTQSYTWFVLFQISSTTIRRQGRASGGQADLGGEQRPGRPHEFNTSTYTDAREQRLVEAGHKPRRKVPCTIDGDPR